MIFNSLQARVPVNINCHHLGFFEIFQTLAPHSFWPYVVLLFAISNVLGCSNSPPKIDHPSIDAVNAGQSAIEQYDKDGDGSLSESELTQCPGILDAIERFDTDRDQQISPEEITERIRLWQKGSTAQILVPVFIRTRNKPVKGAEVRLVPEEFLGANLKTAIGKSNSEGAAFLAVPDSKPRGVPLGIYKVEITHPNRNIPEEYNVQTTIGLEVHTGTSGWQPIVFDVGGLTK